MKCDICGKETNVDGKGDWRISGPFKDCIEKNNPMTFCSSKCIGQYVISADFSFVKS